jgi:hypothetical protein
MAQAEVASDGRRPAVSLRAVVLGAILIPLNTLWLQSMELVWDSGQPTMLSLFFNAVFTLLVLALANLAVRRWLPRWALTPGELVVVYVMVCLASAIGGHDFLQVLVLMLPSGSYFATAENRWSSLFAEQFSSPLLVTRPEAVRDFWEGGGRLYSVAGLSPWLTPTGIWAGFVLVLVGTMMCLNLLVWRRWTEQEKLTYPLIEIPFQVTRPGLDLLGADLLGNRSLWAGFGVAAAIDLLNGFAHLYPSLPSIKVTAYDLSPYLQAYPWRAMGYVTVSAYPFAVGLAYLMPQEFLFASWFFYWLWKVQLVVGDLLGRYQVGFPYVKEQTFGAYVGISVFALWAGRAYFVGLVRDVARGRAPADEARQAVPYRFVLGGLLLGGILLTAYLTGLLGAGLPAALVYLGGYLLMSLAITRMRAEFGLPVHDLFTGPLATMVGIGGTGALGRRNLVGLNLLWWLERVQRSHPMPHGIEGLSLGERRGLPPSGVLAALGVAAVVGTVAGFWSMVHLGHTYGFVTLSTDAPYLATDAFSRSASWLAFPVPPSAGRLLALLVGAGFTIALMLLRQRYVWWPFHPVGYAASGAWFIGLLWVPMFVAWVMKGLVFRYGGHRLYRRLVPFFVGLVLGEFMVGGLWGLVGTVGRFSTYRFWAY